MTEEKLAPKRQTASKRRIAGLVLAAFAILAGGLWLVRQPIAEAIVRSFCQGQKLDCRLGISRLDFGGLTLTGVDVRAPGAKESAVLAQEIVVDLAWDGIFSPRPAAIAGDQLTVRLDLTGKRPILGDLETIVANFTQPAQQPSPPAPRLQIAKLTLVGDTLSGPVYAHGSITAETADAFVIDLAAPSASLGLDGATVALAGGTLQATVTRDRVSGRLALDIARFEAADAQFANVRIDATVEQAAGVLKGEGSARLDNVTVKDASLTGAEAQASVETAAVDFSLFSLNEWLANVRRLDITASTGAGALAGLAWTSAQLRANVQPRAGGGSGGDFEFVAQDLRTAQAVAGEARLAGVIAVTEGVIGVIDGKAVLTSALLTEPQRRALADAIAAPLEAALPVFADTARRAIDRASQAFDAAAPWSASATKDGFGFALDGPVEVRARSGLVLSLTPRPGQPQVGSYSSAGEGGWSGGGRLSLAGGGAPTLTLDIADAKGVGSRTAMTGAFTLRPWKVGADQVSASVANLSFAVDGPAGRASGLLNVAIDGAFGGGVWKGVRGAADVDAAWTADRFTADTDGDARFEWAEAVYGDTRFGKASLRYVPAGRLAENAGEGLVGRGAFGPVAIPVDGGGYAAQVRLGDIGVSWRAAGGFRASFDVAPSAATLSLEGQEIPIQLADISGLLDLRSGWKIAGVFSGGAAQSDIARISDLAGAFDLGGQGDRLVGRLADIAMRVVDPLEEGKRYEDADFTGGADLAAGVARFEGVVAMAKSGMQIARITGAHNLADNSGSLTFDETPLIFRPRQFEPSDISPLLRGPANVTGRADISGAMSWNADGLRASANLNLRNIGFAHAVAGVFEGVNGRVVVSDLLNLRSPPGQQITIERITLGLPIESGTIRFQLVGYDAIALEGAEWPFAGGAIRIEPVRFSFSSTEENLVTATAANWDLAKLVEQLKLPDIKLAGKVAGSFPVMFSAGSAEIRDAVLNSMEPGVIQYSGSAGDAAAQTNDTTRTVFEALKNFRYEVLEAGLDGNLTGEMSLTLKVLGRNPDVLAGTPFAFNIVIDSELVKLLTSTTSSPGVRTVIEQTQGASE